MTRSLHAPPILLALSVALLGACSSDGGGEDGDAPQSGGSSEFAATPNDPERDTGAMSEPGPELMSEPATEPAFEPEPGPEPGRPADTGRLHYSGSFSVSDYQGASYVTANALLRGSDRAPDVLEIELESCVPSSRSVISLSYPAADNSATIVSGETILLDGPAGTFATLSVDDDDRDTSLYSAFLGSPGSVPSSLSVVTLDGEFPTVRLPVPDVETLVVALGESDPGRTGEFRWEAGTVPGAAIVVRLAPSDDVEGTDPWTCRTMDDGEFDVPADVMSSLDGVRTTATLARERTDVDADGRLTTVVRRNSIFFYDR